MDITAMIRHYQRIFKNPKNIISCIENDLRIMGLGEEDIKIEINESKKILGA